MPDQIGGGGETQVHPIILVAMVLAAALMLALPRRRVMAPFLAGAFLIPMDQMLVLGPFHFQMLRILILYNWIAMFIKKRPKEPIFSNGFSGLDKSVILWASFTAIAVVALWQDTAALNNQLGLLYTVLGIYFPLRFFIRDEQDVRHAIQVMAYVTAFIAVVMLSEQITHRNPYAVLGGSRAFTRETLMEREGGLRSLGPFQHPILAGVFGGITLPMFVALWWRDRNARACALVGILASIAVTFCSQSSTPILALAGGIFALCLWPLRKQMRAIRWGLVIVLTTLHLAMKAPIWALIARIDLTGGSSSQHRYMLVDECIKHFSEWWLVGTKYFAKWGWDMWDLANQYVAIADTTGLLPLILFIAILVCAFKYLGRARRAAEKSPRRELFLWGLCATLFANCVGFFGISYFDQTMVAWYLLLAMIPAAANVPGRVKLQPELQSQESSLVYSTSAEPELRVGDIFSR